MSDINAARSLHIFTDGKTIRAGLPFNVGVPLRISGELAARLNDQTTTGDLLAQGFYSGMLAARVTLTAEPERQACLMTVHEMRESDNLLIDFAVACADAAVIGRAGGAYYRPSQAVVNAIAGRKLHMAGKLPGKQLQALSVAAKALGKPYNGAPMGTPYFSMYDVDGEGIRHLNQLAGAVADLSRAPVVTAAAVIQLARCEAGKFVEALAWMRRAQNSRESYHDIECEYGGQMSASQVLSRAATRGTPSFNPTAEYDRGVAVERGDQDELLAKLLANLYANPNETPKGAALS